MTPNEGAMFLGGFFGGYLAAFCVLWVKWKRWKK